MKTAIVIDSTFYTNKENSINKFTNVVPLTVHIDNLVYYEKNNDINQNQEVFKKIFEIKKLAQTSQPSTHDILKTYKKLIDEGYTRILTFNLSSKISGTYQGFCLAAKEIMETNDNVNIEVFDTKLTGQPASIIVRDVHEILTKNNDISTEEINKIIKHYHEKLNIYFTVENLDFLSFGGRINSQIASIGNLFGVKPLLTLEDGEIKKYSTIRGKKQINSEIEKLFLNSNIENKKIVLMGVYTTTDKVIKKMMYNINNLKVGNIVYEEMGNVGLVLANHLGPNAYGIIWGEKYQQ